MVFEWLTVSLLLEIIKDFSYVGIFAISAVSTSTIFIPLPLYAVIFLASGVGLHPILVGISAGLGSAVGELTSYFVGIGSSHVIEEKFKKGRAPKVLKWFIKFFKKYGFASIVATSLLPFPFDIVGLLAGAAHYDLKRFLLATFIGKTGKTLFISYAGFFAIPGLQAFFTSVI